ncbi:efflux RND transporter periplasmic adaptor subunit [Thiomicrorhabdus sp. Kp2]|uniref:efflux RND transporter periplasmic adaptor subunit n=1 Tax=Thiomicrorhabdus sp. Kp2 TaxID=1123518 RepID=UPI00040C4DCF|nr:efflux RND transporter periplasmic adaptor subunit [Thiomicrorhabdus sp. Kp2]
MRRFVSVFFITLFSSMMLNSAYAEEEMHHDSHTHDAHDSSELPEIGSSSGADLVKYVCPMHPQIVRDHEGICPLCGMDLVKQIFKQNVSTPKISVSGESANGLQQGLAIRTSKVERVTLWKYIPTFGKVVADDANVIHIHPRASGWISDLSVRSNGESVEKGQMLYRLYSPEIVSAQQDLLLARQNQKRLGNQANTVLESAKTRLELLGVSKDDIARIIQKRRVIHKIPVYASQAGVAGNLIVQDGMYVEPQTELMSLTDLSRVWVEAEVLPLQQNWIRDGLTASLSSEAFPKSEWESFIEYIYPVTDVKTQALKVRLPVENSANKLKSNMFMDVAIYGGPKRNVLAIPLEAVVDDGKTKRVVKALQNGQFEVSELTTGMQSEGFVEVLSGLSEGETIVTSGQFLIDSESQIQSNLQRLISGSTSSNDSNE